MKQSKRFLWPPLVRLAGLLCLLALAPLGHAAPQDYYRITVVDADTGRGVPLVALTTVNAVTFYTDSNGIVAVHEPDLMGRTVWFGVKSHGYEFPADGFGNRGVALDVKAGGQAQIKIKRVNIAERLYRITGAGIYRDSILVGQPVPIQQPLLNGLVMGQDTVMATPYWGKLYWFYGDTERPGYPLGQFATSGATSKLPGQGGLDPGQGVDLTYWTDASGFSRPMLPLPGFGGPVWVGGVFTLKDANGAERLYTHFSHLDHDGKTAEHGLAVFDDAKAVFEPICRFALEAPLYPDGQPFHAVVNGQPYLYFQSKTLQAYPLVRVRADEAHVTDAHACEAFTCLAPGARYEGANTRLDRGRDGRLIYAWKADTAVLGYDDQQALVTAGKLKPEEALAPLRDVETDAPIHSHGGSVFWNAYRKRWVMISGQASGTSSYLGEIWFAEADTPVGPWTYARKIVTHDHYTFYNPTQHPFFDQQGGRLIYFEGTYTDAYSGSADLTPRYNYNQIMYRLDLGDPRLSLPVPVYALAGPDGYGLRETVDARHEWGQVRGVPFFAVPPNRPHAGLIPVPAASFVGAGGPLLFYALPPTPAAGEKASPAVVPLYECRDEHTNALIYLTDPASPSLERLSARPLCRVWRNPSTVHAWDPAARPAPQDYPSRSRAETGK